MGGYGRSQPRRPFWKPRPPWQRTKLGRNVTTAGAAGRRGSIERALLLHRAEYGEADLIVGLFTEGLGALSAIARSARRSRRRFGGSLEPLHTLRVEITQRNGRELATLESAEIEQPRFRILQHLGALQAAGRALAWVRRCIPPQTPEPRVWNRLNGLLGELDDPTGGEPVDARLAIFGAHLLSELGWALELERCVRCGKPCPPERSAAVSPTAGGIVCRRCGSAPQVLRPALRIRLASLTNTGNSCVLDPSESALALALFEDTLRVHAGLDLSYQGHRHHG